MLSNKFCECGRQQPQFHFCVFHCIDFTSSQLTGWVGHNTQFHMFYCLFYSPFWTYCHLMCPTVTKIFVIWLSKYRVNGHFLFSTVNFLFLSSFLFLWWAKVWLMYSLLSDLVWAPNASVFVVAVTINTVPPWIQYFLLTVFTPKIYTKVCLISCSQEKAQTYVVGTTTHFCAPQCIISPADVSDSLWWLLSPQQNHFNSSFHDYGEISLTKMTHRGWQMVQRSFISPIYLQHIPAFLFLSI